MSVDIEEEFTHRLFTLQSIGGGDLLILRNGARTELPRYPEGSSGRMFLDEFIAKVDSLHIKGYEL